MTPLLYHGSPGLLGNTIELKSNTGVGWNTFTLGNGFYTSVSEPAARLFSHLALQSQLLRQGKDPGDVTTGKIYQIKIKDDINILDEHSPLDPQTIRGVLSRAGIREDTIRSQSDAYLSKLDTVINLLAYGKNYACNPYEYLIKSLGFDALKINEKTWDKWDYYPSNIGVNWESFNENYDANPPTTVVIYDTSKIKSFKLLCHSEQLLTLPWEQEKKKDFIQERGR